MKIQITRFADVTEIDGDEDTLAQMISIHGAKNVVNLDAEIVQVDYPEPEEPVLVDQAPLEPVLPDEPAVDPVPDAAPVELPVEAPAQE
jgi:hypothetical protein